MANLIERSLELVNSKSKTEAVSVFLKTLPDVMFARVIIYHNAFAFLLFLVSILGQERAFYSIYLFLYTYA